MKDFIYKKRNYVEHYYLQNMRVEGEFYEVSEKNFWVIVGFDRNLVPMEYEPGNVNRKNFYLDGQLIAYLERKPIIHKVRKKVKLADLLDCVHGNFVHISIGTNKKVFLEEIYVGYSSAIRNELDAYMDYDVVFVIAQKDTLGKWIDQGFPFLQIIIQKKTEEENKK